MGGTICVCRRSPDQVSRALLWLPYYIVKKMLSCIESAEKKLNRPPSCLEVFVEMKIRYKELPINNLYQGGAVIASLLREDWIYTNDVASHVSLIRHEGFCTFSEMF